MRCRYPVIAVLLIHVGLLAWSACRHSPTLDEPAHLVAGVSHWEFLRFEMYRVNPPLARMVAVLPVLAAGHESDWEGFTPSPGARTEFVMGRQFVAANGRRSLWLTTLARWAGIPWSLLGAWVCYLWARDLYGRTAGVVALVLWCFTPDILGHAPLVTPDVAATALGLAACYAFWKWLREPSWSRAIVSGLLLGIAGLTKFTTFILFPLWPAIWLACRLPQRGQMTARRWGGDLGMLAVTVILGLNVITLGYALDEPLKPLGSFEFVSRALGGEKADGLTGNRFRGTWLESLPVPLPAEYLRGIDVQRKDFEGHGFASYLRGTFAKRGWWYYYLYGMGVKVPLGTWLLVLLAAVGRRSGGGTSVRRADELVLLAPALVILASVSSQMGFNQHIRYVLPIYPFAMIWMSRVACQPSRTIRAAALLAGLWAVGSSLSIYPHSLSYFNELAGGPRGGHAHLLNSNVDWGQDLLFLQGWMDQHRQARPLYLVYFGAFDPEEVGVQFDTPEFGESADGRPKAKLVLGPGWYAISVNFLRGYAWDAPTSGGGRIWLPQDACTELLAREPAAAAGYSIYIYHISADDSGGILGAAPAESAGATPR